MTLPNANIKSTAVPSFNIIRNGTSLNIGQLLSIQINTEIGKIPEAEIIFFDGDKAKGKFEISEKLELVPGEMLVIQLGYSQQNKTIFTGQIIKQNIRSTTSQNTTLTIELKHVLYKSTLVRKNAVSLKIKDSDMIEAILGKYKLPKNVQSTSIEHQQMMQVNATDWDFINMRAEANNLYVFPKNDKVYVKPCEVVAEKVELAYNRNIIDVDLELDNRVNFESFIGKTWNVADQTIEDIESNSKNLEEIGILKADQLASMAGHGIYTEYEHTSLNPNEFSRILNRKKTIHALSKVKGIVKCEGTSDVEIGDTIKLSALGDRFNGKAFVSGVSHEFSAGRWFTTFQIGIPSERFIDRYTNINEKPASGLLPSFNGLQIGVVSKIVSEDSEPLVLVKIPIASMSDDAVWARVAKLDAGPKRGIVFLPEVGDEVILGFINDDPRHAIILGMLHSSKLPAPDDLKAEEKNAKKGIYTREGLKLLFDDEKKIITINTLKSSIEINDDKKTIKITDEGNKNTATFSDKGVSFECEKDFIIKAKGNIKIEGKAISLKAKSKFEAEGSSGMSLKSNGTTDLKGTMVNIN